MRGGRTWLALACALCFSACVRWGYDPVSDGGDGSDAGLGMDAGAPTGNGDAGSDAGPGTEAGVPTGHGDAGSMGADASAADASLDASPSGDAAPGVDAGDGGSAAGSEDKLERASEVEIGSFVWSGAACPTQPVVADLTDRPMLSHFNFLGFALQVGAGTSATQSCSLSLALTVPPRLSLRMVGGSWQGDYRLSANGSASIATSYLFEGDSPGSSTRDFSAATAGSFDIDDDVRVAAATSAGWSACSAQAGDLIARATVTFTGADDITVTIRSGSVFRIESQSCTPP